jgi:two-component system, LytTR family, response regulator AgrA
LKAGKLLVKQIDIMYIFTRRWEPMLHFTILDDDFTHNMNTYNRLKLIFEKYEIEATIALNTTDATDVIEYCTRNNTNVNVYLLDVDVHSSINGIGVASIIREKDAKAYIIFISAHPEYVMSSLKTKVFDYLIKPVSIETLSQCINSIYKDFNKVNSNTLPQLSIKSGFNVYNLNYNEITFLEKYGHLLVVHTVSGKIESSESLDSIESKLDKNNFFRSHKSCIVNISHISRIDNLNNIIHLKNGESCLVSKRCKKELKIICGFI